MLDRTLWHGKYRRSSVPSFPCSRCKNGRLIFQRETLQAKEPKWSEADHDNPYYDPDFDTERFTAFAICDRGDCGDVVAIAGYIDFEEADDPHHGFYNIRVLSPEIMHPPPAIINIPDGTPDAVKEELELSFQLFWSDFGSCATRVRTSVERLMDHYGVPKYQLVKKKGGGKQRRRLDLYTRIKRFCTVAKNVVHEDHLHAIRAVGNLGTHDGTMDRDVILDAYEVYEHALQEMIARKSTQIKKLAAKLRKMK